MLDYKKEFATADAAGVVEFCRRAAIDPVRLQELGQRAKDRGSASYDTEKRHEVSDGVEIGLLRRLEPSWSDVDGTIQRSDEDDKNRYRKGPTNNENSCAIDSALFCAIRLDLGRRQVDQLAPALLMRLSNSALAIRRVVDGAWGLYAQGVRNELRDVLREVLIAGRPDRFAHGKMVDFSEIFTDCVEGLPQLSYTKISVTQCCDGRQTVGVSQRRTGFWVLDIQGSKESMEERMNGLFREKRIVPTEDCTNGAQCTRVATKTPMVLDRLPPVLWVMTPNSIPRSNDKFWHLFEPFELRYHTGHVLDDGSTSDERTKRYDALGCVLWKNRNHFIVRWRGREGEAGDVMSYDGIAGEDIYPVKSWWDEMRYVVPNKGKKLGPNSKPGVIAMFYGMVA